MTDPANRAGSRAQTLAVSVLLIVTTVLPFAWTSLRYGVPFFRMRGNAAEIHLPFWQAADDDYWYGFGIHDEGAHYDQICRFKFGFRAPTTVGLTTIPGYHATMAVFGWLTGDWQLRWFRLCHLVVCLGFVGLWAWMIRRPAGAIPLPEFLQFFFMPIFYLYYFVLYTDIMSLGLLLIAYEFNKRRRYGESGLVGLAALLVRQTNIVWLGFFGVLGWAREFKLRLTIESVGWMLTECWAYLLGLFFFLGWVYVHDGIALSDTSMHPGSLHIGNLWFFLLVHLICFLPLYVAHLPDVGRRYFRNWKMALVALLPGVILYWPYTLLYQSVHPYNIIRGFIRNDILRWREFSILNMSIVYVLLYFALLGLSTMRFREKNHYLLWPFAVLSLLPCWLIEQRYYIPIFGFFMLFRKPESRRTEWALAAWIFVLGLLAVWGLVTEHYFL